MFKEPNSRVGDSETNVLKDLRPIPLLSWDKDVVLLFFKIYDPEKEELRYGGRLFVKSSDKPTDILLRLNQMADYEPDEEIELYEEIKSMPSVTCKHIDKRVSFINCKLENGDIVYYQKSLSSESSQRFRFPDVPSFFENRHNLHIKLLIRNLLSGYRQSTSITMNLMSIFRNT